jgi:hypothetical protein
LELRRAKLQFQRLTGEGPWKISKAISNNETTSRQLHRPDQNNRLNGMEKMSNQNPASSDQSWHYKDTMAYANYGLWLATFQYKFYSRCGLCLNFLSIFLGSAVIGLAVNNQPILTALVGVFVTVIGTIQMVVPFTENAFKAKDAKDRFIDFTVDLPEMGEKEAKTKLAELQKTGVASYYSMEMMAINRCREQQDIPERVDEGWSSKFFRMFI